MDQPRCCDNTVLEWRQTRVAGRWADVSMCRSCEHIHEMRSWLVPEQWDASHGCVNCGGHREPQGACDRCGFTEESDRSFHERLLDNSPGETWLEAAEGALEVQRYVLALKMSTAAARWGRDFDQAMRLRLAALEGLDLVDQALGEAVEWSDQGAPAWIHGVIAGLHCTRSDIRAALASLDLGLQLDPADASMWIDFAELLQHVGDHRKAAEAATRALDTPGLESRALDVIRDAARQAWDDGQYEEAEARADLAGAWQERDPHLAWVRAQVATFHAHHGDAGRWAQVVLAHWPDHEEARAMVERSSHGEEPEGGRRKKRRWFPW